MQAKSAGWKRLALLLFGWEGAWRLQVPRRADSDALASCRLSPLLQQLLHLQKLDAPQKHKSRSAVGRRGLEPLTPCASCKCATNCANGPVPRDPTTASGTDRAP